MAQGKRMSAGGPSLTLLTLSYPMIVSAAEQQKLLGAFGAGLLWPCVRKRLAVC